MFSKLLKYSVALEALALGASAQIKFGTPDHGLDDWSEAYTKAQALVSQMTLEEMNNVTLGISVDYTGCVGVSGGVPRLGFPGLCFQDAGNGIRGAEGTSAFASGVSLGASWNTELTYERALYMGAEYKRKGVNVALGPVVGPIGRIALGGRNWEGFGADPYLDGILGAVSVEGLQKSVMSSIKHFVANEQELNRNPDNFDPSKLASSSNVDDKTMHELYLWPFEDLVNAGAACTMCSYQRINDTYGCENHETQNVILREELGFKGFVVSDWGAQHSGLKSAINGLDVVMPSSGYWNETQLAKAVNNGTLERSVLENMALRTVAAWYHVHHDEPSQPPLGVGIPKSLLAPHDVLEARDPASKQNLLDQAIEGHVLVKNVNNALPLKKPKVMSIFGYDATLQASYTPTGAPGFDGFLGNWLGVNLTLAQALYGQGPKPQRNPGLLTTGGGSGAAINPYVLSPYDVIARRAEEDNSVIFYDFASANPNVVDSSDVCLVFINEYASEGYDRPGLADEFSDQIVNNVSSKCNNTIVTIHNAGIRIVEEWIENPNITAVLYAHLPGQDAGRSLDKILYGEVSPSGRLPYTVGKNAGDYGSLLEPCPNPDNITSPQCDFTEGVNIDYRDFLKRGVEPRYAFGYGLTYSEFEYSGLEVDVNTAPGYPTLRPRQASSATSYQTALFEQVGTVKATITNTGDVAAAEVAQLYLHIPGAETRTLRGFQKLFLQPGESKDAEFKLRRKDISSWNVVTQAWEVPEGEFNVYVGKSVLDVPLTGSF